MEGAVMLPSPGRTKAPVGSPLSPTRPMGTLPCLHILGRTNEQKSWNEKHHGTWVPGGRTTPCITRGAVGALRMEEGEESRRAL